MPPKDLLNHPTKPCSLEACKLAEPRTVQASPLQRKSNGRELRQVVSRFIRSSAATILPSDFEEGTEHRGLDQPASAVPVPLPDRRPLLLPLLPAPCWLAITFSHAWPRN